MLLDSEAVTAVSYVTNCGLHGENRFLPRPLRKCLHQQELMTLKPHEISKAVGVKGSPKGKGCVIMNQTLIFL